MSTRRVQDCPMCGAPTLPQSRFVWLCGVRANQWVYICVCEWTWADDLQRVHNDREFGKALRGPSMYS